MERPNGDTESRFELDFEDPQLNHGSGQRTALDRDIVYRTAGETGYKVIVKCVQYKTFQNMPACLFALNVSFWWNDTKRGRYKSAKIEISLHQVDKDGLSVEDDPGPNIIQLAPVLVYGDPKDETVNASWTLGASIGVTGNAGGAVAGVEASRSSSLAQTRERRMRIQGRKYGPLDQDHEDTAVWTMEENAVQKDGVLDSFTCAVVFAWPVDMYRTGIHALCTVKPQLAFSLKPQVLYKLRPTAVNPIGFDGKTARGIDFAEGRDLADRDVDWALLLGRNKQYEDQMLVA